MSRFYQEQRSWCLQEVPKKDLSNPNRHVHKPIVLVRILLTNVHVCARMCTPLPRKASIHSNMPQTTSNHSVVFFQTFTRFPDIQISRRDSPKPKSQIWQFEGPQTRAGNVELQTLRSGYLGLGISPTSSFWPSAFQRLLVVVPKNCCQIVSLKNAGFYTVCSSFGLSSSALHGC